MSQELLDQQRARLLAIVDVELGRIYKQVKTSPLDRDQRATLEALARILKELEKREPVETKPGAKQDLSAEEIIKRLSGPASGTSSGVL